MAAPFIKEIYSEIQRIFYQFQNKSYLNPIELKTFSFNFGCLRKGIKNKNQIKKLKEFFNNKIENKTTGRLIKQFINIYLNELF
jgi:hypothetical protein